MCKVLFIILLAIVFLVSHSSGQPVQERYLSPDGKYAVEIAGEGGRPEIYIRKAGSNERQPIATFNYPVQGPPLFFHEGLTPLQIIRKKWPQYANMSDDVLLKKIHDRFYPEESFDDFKNRTSRPGDFLVLHTGTISIGTWPVVFKQSGESTLKLYEFDPTQAVEFLKKFNKIPNGFKIAHLYMEVTVFREPNILELSCRGDGIWNQHQTPFKSATLYFSLWTKEYLAPEEHASIKQIPSEIAGYALAGIGTGFFVGKDGWILTCNHVVSDADQLKVLISTGQILRCAIVDKDPDHDLALLRIQGEAPAVVPIALDRPAAVGDVVYTAGFPVPKIEGFSPKVTSGTINSLTGLEDDPNELQISAPVQPGNSGGALISEEGCLLGIVAARMKEESFLEVAGVLPQNVNYAEKASMAWALLDKQDIAPETVVFQTKQEAIQNLTKASVLVLAYRHSDQSQQAPSEPVPTPNFTPPPTAPSYTTPAPKPRPKLTPAPTPVRDHSDAKWPDGRILAHPKHFVNTGVVNVAPNDTLKLRSGPETKSKPVTEIPSNGTDITAFDQDQVWDGDTYWCPVEWHGFRGYVGRHYLPTDN